MSSPSGSPPLVTPIPRVEAILFFVDHLDWFVFVIAYGRFTESDVGGDYLFALWAAPGLFVHQIAKICFAIHWATGDATPLPACLYRCESACSVPSAL